MKKRYLLTGTHLFFGALLVLLFSTLPSIAKPRYATIGDTVFCDFNRDGIQETGEPGLAGVSLNLTGNGLNLTTVTDANGHYLFDDLPVPGIYTVTVDPTTAPPGCNVILPNCPLTRTIKIKGAYQCLFADFCFGTNGQIGDTVFCDVNRNGVQDTGEPGLEGVTVTLVGEGFNLMMSTDANGHYLFDNLPPGTYTVSVDPTTAPAGCNIVIDNCPLSHDITIGPGGVNLDADFCFAEPDCHQGVIGGVNLSGLATAHLFFFGNGSKDANWQSASKGFQGDVAVDGILASERTSGTVPFAGVIATSDSTLSAWQSIINSNSGQASELLNQVSQIASLKATLVAAIQQINALPVTPGFESVSSTSLDGLNTQNGVAETFVINVTSDFQVKTEIDITGDAGDVYILRWDTDANPSNGFQGQVKFQSGGAIVPHGELTAGNFIHVCGDMNASGGGGNPPAPYPQGPRFNNGTGDLIAGGANWGGGGFFTGYWLSTGAPTTFDPATGLYTGDTSPFSNAIFVGGWYTCTTKFSMTSGTSGVYVSPNCP